MCFKSGSSRNKTPQRLRSTKPTKVKIGKRWYITTLAQCMSIIGVSVNSSTNHWRVCKSLFCLQVANRMSLSQMSSLNVHSLNSWQKSPMARCIFSNKEDTLQCYQTAKHSLRFQGNFSVSHSYIWYFTLAILRSYTQVTA